MRQPAAVPCRRAETSTGLHAAGFSSGLSREHQRGGGEQREAEEKAPGQCRIGARQPLMLNRNENRSRLRHALRCHKRADAKGGK